MMRLAGRYVLREVIGTGGSAEVWRADDTQLGVARAVKVLRLDANHRETLRRRLRQEATVMARLSHPNVLRIHDVGNEGDLDYIVMDYSSRGNLAELASGGTQLPVVDVIRYAIQVLRALSAAHRAGVVHRDVKPQNILLDEHGNALLADFGIALFDDGTASRNTRGDVAMGSLAFMAPEQRLDAHAVTGQADLYALAATVYALLTQSTPMDLFLAADSSTRWDGVPQPLRAVLRKNLSLAPEERSTNALAMASELARATRKLGVDDLEIRTLPPSESGVLNAAVSPEHMDGLSAALIATTLADTGVAESEASWAGGGRMMVVLVLAAVLIAAGGWLLRDWFGARIAEGMVPMPASSTSHMVP